MARKRYPKDETRCIDDCICPYCGYKFNGQQAINNDLDTGTINCPQCGKEMEVYMSVEYTCIAIDNESASV